MVGDRGVEKKKKRDGDTRICFFDTRPVRYAPNKKVMLFLNCVLLLAALFVALTTNVTVGMNSPTARGWLDEPSVPTRDSGVEKLLFDDNRFKRALVDCSGAASIRCAKNNDCRERCLPVRSNGDVICDTVLNRCVASYPDRGDDGYDDPSATQADDGDDECLEKSGTVRMAIGSASGLKWKCVAYTGLVNDDGTPKPGVCGGGGRRVARYTGRVDCLCPSESIDRVTGVPLSVAPFRIGDHETGTPTCVINDMFYERD